MKPLRENKSDRLKKAVVRPIDWSAGAAMDNLFAWMFRGLVYPQIWEDPVVDMAALEIHPGHHLVTIASGGCNVLSYLVAGPARITAVDLNTTHVALNRLKLAAAERLPDWQSFHRFFGNAASEANVAAYRRHIAPHLDPQTRAYWEGRSFAGLGRPRIMRFADNFYRHGLLGRFIGIAHRLARSYGTDFRPLLVARSIAEQRRFFETEIEPLFEKRFVRWLTGNSMSLFGLGIPPAQYAALAAAGGDRGMASVLRDRLERLVCDFPVNENYFAWQAFARGYDRSPTAPMPPYLERWNFEAVRTRTDRVDVLNRSVTEFLARQPGASCDRYVLLDAQDWMTDEQLQALWREITRTARPGARVVFRTAASPSLLPGRVDDGVLSRWTYQAEASRRFHARDRSAIYGGFHLYVLAD